MMITLLAFVFFLRSKDHEAAKEGPRPVAPVE
jgi:hypothetical protein